MEIPSLQKIFHCIMAVTLLINLIVKLGQYPYQQQIAIPLIITTIEKKCILSLYLMTFYMKSMYECLRNVRVFLLLVQDQHLKDILPLICTERYQEVSWKSFVFK